MLQSTPVTNPALEKQGVLRAHRIAIYLKGAHFSITTNEVKILTEWWLICQKNVDDIRKNLDEIIDSTSEVAVQSARDALMSLDTRLH